MPKLIRLPDQAGMLARLLRMDSDGTLQAVFYPMLLAEAGREIYAQSFAVRLAGIVARTRRNIPETLAKELIPRIPAFIEALIDDAEALEEAKLAWQRSQR